MATPSNVLFPWNDSYSVNIGIIDAQHKQLVGAINELHLAMSEGRAKDQLGQILSKLVNYTKGHFATEEKLMESRGYADYAAHKAEHDRLTSTVTDFQRRFMSNEVGLTLEIMEFLKNWLAKHILGSDRKYSPFLNAKGVR